MKILITGCAGFIGFHLSKRLIQEKYHVVGIDNLNNYYDPNLKKARLEELNKLAKEKNQEFNFESFGIENSNLLEDFFKKYKPSRVINLAAQAGVRYSIENPSAYIQSNIVGFCNILELCRHTEVKHLVYASSSSVYGGNTKMPFSEEQSVAHPVSLYAASKKSNELMAHTYSHLYNLPATGLRFFTVYGPWGRPDMALFLFTNAILSGKKIQVFNQGNMIRDFTYIDDIVESLFRLIFKEAKPDENFDTSKPSLSTSWAPHRIFNIGNSKPVQLMEYINALENSLGVSAIKEFLPMQPGDVPATSADTSALEDWIGFKPNTSITDGINRFVNWYRNFYSVF